MAILTTTNQGLNFIGGTTFIQTGTTTLMAIATNGDIQFSQYGAGTLVTDASGNITVSSGGGAGGPYLPLSAGDSYPLTGNLVIEGNAKVLRLKRDANQSWIQYVGSNDDFIIRDETDGRSAFIAEGGGNVYFPGGNVGIGTTSPSKLLTLNDASGAALQWQYNSGNYLRIEADSGGGSYYAAAGLYHRFFTSGSERMRITSDGKVGIGITAITASVNADDLQIGNGTGGNRGLTVTAASNSGAAIYFGDADNTNMGSVRYDNSNDSMKFFTNTSEQIRIASTGDVGIGTTSPGAKLHVTGNNVNASEATVRIGGVPSFGNGVSRLELVENMSANVMTYGFSLTADGNSTNNLLIRNHNNSTVGNVAIAVDRITSNVGIGTTSPGVKMDLEVDSASNGDLLRLTNSNTGGGSKRSAMIYRLTDSVGTRKDAGYIRVQGTNNNITGGASMQFWTRKGDVNPTESMRINTNGNVGIGTTSPGAKLNVVAGTGSPTVLLGRATGQASIKADTDSSGHLIIDSSTGHVYINNYVNKNIYLANGGGNVGIGTTSPDTKLDIVSGTNNGIRISATDTTSNWRDISIRSYVSEAQANALGDSTHIYTSSPAGTTTETPFGFYGATVIQGRNNGNGGFAIRLGNGSGHSTMMWMGSTGVTVFSNTVTATNFILSSDERLKENIEKACDNRIKADWKTFELKTDKGQKRYGVIAQELEKTNPEFVREDTQGFKSVAYIDLLIAKIAELEARLEKAGI